MFEEGHSLCSKKDTPCVRGHSLCSRKDIPCVRRKTFLVFEEGHSVCSKEDIPCVRRRTFLVSKAGHSMCSTQDMSCVPITNNAHVSFEQIKPIVPGYVLIGVGCGANLGTIGLTRPKVAFQRVRPTLNGPKIARMAPISTIF